MVTEKEIFKRSLLLLGDEVMERIAAAKVILFGVGGVGSWCAESLVRTGIRHLTIVDADRVATSNINRQLMATTETVGRAKVDVLKERLLTINPHAEINAIEGIFTEETANQFHLDEYDFIIDAIDSLSDKMLLIELACRTKAKFFSSMGAALKLDPTKIQVAEFWKVKGDPLARALRNKFKHAKRFPAKKFLCVFSDELLTNQGLDDGSETLLYNKVQTNGSIAHITAIFGFTLAGLVIKNCAQMINDK
jgi:tRNA A37 threonylcarbamoyladenosine dehydratase